jgi:glycosyltransferase involved in cell wall biosynthesis
MSTSTIIFIWAPFVGKVGTELAMVNYARALRDGGKNVQLVSVAGEFLEYGSEFECISLRPIKFISKLITAPVFRGRLLALYCFIAAVKLRFKIPANVTIIAGLNAIPLLFVFRVLKRQERIIVSVQGFPKFLLKEKQNIFYSGENLLRKFIWSRFYAKADKLITMTLGTKARLKATFSFPRVDVISNPLFQIAPPLRKWRANRGVNILYVGRLSYQKDPDLFIQVARIAQQVHPELSFSIMGTGEEEERLRKLSSDLSNIKFLGYVQNPWKHYENENLVHLVTSRWEDPGHAMLESMARSIPTLVVRRDSPHSELATEYGAQVCDISSEQINEAIIRVISDIDLTTLTSIAEKVSSDFSLSNFSKSLGGSLHE